VTTNLLVVRLKMHLVLDRKAWELTFVLTLRPSNVRVQAIQERAWCGEHSFDCHEMSDCKFDPVTSIASLTFKDRILAFNSTMW